MTDRAVFNALKSFLISNVTDLDDKNCVIDFPDPDTMRKNVMVYIVPDYAENEELTTSSRRCTCRLNIHILCKGAKASSLFDTIFGYYEQVETALISDQTLGGVVDGIEIPSYDYYPAVDAENTKTAINAQVTISYAKEF